MDKKEQLSLQSTELVDTDELMIQVRQEVNK